MSRRKWFRPNGTVAQTRATRIRWGDTNVPVSTGLTRGQYHKRIQECKDRVMQHSPWVQVSRTTRVRDVSQALALLAMDHFDSVMVVGHSTLSYHAIAHKRIKYADDNITSEWGIAEGEPYQTVWDECDGRSCYKGDDASIKNMPKDWGSTTIGGVWGQWFKNGHLHHSPYCNIATIISGEGCHSPIVKHFAMKQMSMLCQLKKLVFWSQKLQCWILMKNESDSCFDWVFETSITGLIGHSGLYFLHGVTKMCQGDPYGVPYNRKLLKQLFITDIDPSHYSIDLDEWKQERKSGFVLTTPEIHTFQAKLASKEFVKCYREAESKGKEDKFEDLSYCTKIRRQIANDFGICVAGNNSFKWYYNLITDFFHAFNNYVLYQIKGIGIGMHGMNKYSCDVSSDCMSKMGLKFVTKSYNKYLDENPRGNLEKDWHFTSNGDGFKMICAQLYHVTNAAGWVEHEILEAKLADNKIEDIINGHGELTDDNVDMSIFIPTMKLAAYYTAHKYLRRGWAGIWSSKITPGINGDLSPQAKEIKQNFRKGFNIQLEYIEETVCVIYCGYVAIFL